MLDVDVQLMFNTSITQISYLLLKHPTKCKRQTKSILEVCELQAKNQTNNPDINQSRLINSNNS